MNGITIALMIISGLVILFILWKVFKPYIIRYDTTALFTGGLGSGKTYNSVWQSIVCVRKNRFFKYYLPKLKYNLGKPFRRIHNKHIWKHFYKRRFKVKLIKLEPQRPKKPLLYSNIPICFKTHVFGFKKEWSVQLDIEHILLFKEIREYSVVMIDEFPQFISQFEWDEELVQKNANEFITFFRHYIGGNLIINAQSEDEIECHFRRKLNIGMWCFNFKVWPFPILPLFYTCRMCDFMISENIQTMSTTYVEDNTRWRIGIFRKQYDSRCYSPRYKKVHIKVPITKRWQKLKTTKVLRIKKYISPLDDKTTLQQIEAMERKAEQLQRSDE